MVVLNWCLSLDYSVTKFWFVGRIFLEFEYFDVQTLMNIIFIFFLMLQEYK